MVLSPEKKLALLNAAKKIYQTYSALEIFKTKEFDIDGHQTTVLDFILQAKPGLTLTINTDNNEYTVNITNEAEGKRISISSKNAAAAFHSFIEYEENTSFALDLLCQHDFFIGHDNQVEIRLDQAFLGKNKIDLYRSHLVTIHNIITKLENEDDISNLLVALATGSGKTYVQALWMFILKQANCNGLFCIPDKLIPQFKDDLRRFLPDSMVDEIIILREKEDSPDAKAAISDLNNPNNTSHIVLASSEAILDNHYQELFDTNTDNAFFCFDEQHLLMKSERRRMRLIELSKKHLSMFLTATPNEETYELAGNKPVAIMSSGQKEQAGQGQFPKMFTEEAINYSDRNKLDDYRFWQLAFWENMANGLFLRFINSIQEEQSSAGISIVENLPFYLHRKPNETTERWALQAPVAHKILCIVDDNETLINLVMATQRSNSRDNRLDRTVYHNGNFISRQDAYEFFTLPMIDDNLVETHLEKKQHAYSLLNPEKIAREVAHRSLADQIKINIFHNLVNYILTDLTGFDTIKLNELRKKDLDGLVKLVKQKLTVKNEAYFRQKLQEKIGQDEASEVSPLLAELSQWLNNNKNNTVPFNKVIDNWDLNNSLKYLDSAYQSKFEAYANSHLALGLMTNMDKAETAIHESKPFLGFADNTYKLYDNDGALVSQAKKRARSSLEILSDQTEETSLSPNYIDITEEQADNLFRLGFVGMYVTNKKTEGFSDRNLHTVINLAEHSLDKTNNPETQIQGIGRNRGLDDTVVPSYIHALGRGEHSVFNLEHLKKDDYYPDLFSAQAHYDQEYLEVLGKQLGQNIVKWFYANIDETDRINTDQFKQQILRYIAEALRHLNNNNKHKIELSREHLVKVIDYAMDDLQQTIDNLNEPYKLSLFVRILGTILNFLCECYYMVKKLPAFFNLLMHSFDSNKTQADKTYLKIMKATNFKEITENFAVAREFKDWFDKKAKAIELTLTKNTDDYLSDETLVQLETFKIDYLLPLISKFVTEGKRQALVDAFNNMPHILPFLSAQKDNISAIFESKERVKERTLDVLRAIPGAPSLTLADIRDFNAEINQGIEALEDPFSNDEVKNKQIAHIVNYLQGEFLDEAVNLFLASDFAVLKSTLTTSNKLADFVKYLLNEKIELSDLDTLVIEFKTFFTLEHFETPPKRALELETQLKFEANNVFANLKDIEILVKDLRQASFSFVNLYPLQNREELINLANPDNIRHLLIKKGNKLLENAETADKTLIYTFFDLLCELQNHPPIKPIDDIEKQAQIEISTLKVNFMKIFDNKGEAIVKKIFSPSSWLNTNSNPMDIAVSDFLKSDIFLNNIASLFPFGSWKNIRNTLKQDEKKRLALARAIINKALEAQKQNLDFEEAFSEQTILELINSNLGSNHPLIMQSLELSQVRLTSFFEELQANPYESLNAETQERLADLIQSKLIPLLSLLIKDINKREEFLSKEFDISFILKNRELIQSTLTSEDRTDEEIADLLNSLIQNREEFNLEAKDLVDSKQNAIESEKRINNALKTASLKTLLRSSLLLDTIKVFFNENDYRLLESYLKDEEKLTHLIKHLIDNDLSSPQDIFDFLKSQQGLETIKTFEERGNSFADFTREIKLVPQKVANLYKDLLKPVLFNQRFKAIINNLIAYLDEDDFTLLLDSLGEGNPNQKAKQLVKFIQILEEEDEDALASEFLTPKNADDLEQIPLKDMLDLLKKLFTEVSDCHCFFNHQDLKGNISWDKRPKIYGKLSEDFKELKVDASYTFLNSFSRKVFFIQGVRNGLPIAGEINAESNRERRKELERVRNHLLSAAWWGTNSPKLFNFYETIGSIGSAFKQAYFSVVNAFKKGLNIFGANFTISVPNKISQDYKETGYCLAEKINELSALDSTDIKLPTCPKDAIISLEKKIDDIIHFPSLFRRKRTHNTVDELAIDIPAENSAAVSPPSS